jgi:hypothetical protein
MAQSPQINLPRLHFALRWSEPPLLFKEPLDVQRFMEKMLRERFANAENSSYSRKRVKVTGPGGNGFERGFMLLSTASAARYIFQSVHDKQVPVSSGSGGGEGTVSGHVHITLSVPGSNRQVWVRNCSAREDLAIIEQEFGAVRQHQRAESKERHGAIVLHYASIYDAEFVINHFQGKELSAIPERRRQRLVLDFGYSSPVQRRQQQQWAGGQNPNQQWNNQPNHQQQQQHYPPNVSSSQLYTSVVSGYQQPQTTTQAQALAASTQGNNGSLHRKRRTLSSSPSSCSSSCSSSSDKDESEHANKRQRLASAGMDENDEQHTFYDHHHDNVHNHGEGHHSDLDWGNGISLEGDEDEVPVSTTTTSLPSAKSHNDCDLENRILQRLLARLPSHIGGAPTPSSTSSSLSPSSSSSSSSSAQQQQQLTTAPNPATLRVQVCDRACAECVAYAQHVQRAHQEPLTDMTKHIVRAWFDANFQLYSTENQQHIIAVPRKVLLNEHINPFLASVGLDTWYTRSPLYKWFVSEVLRVSAAQVQKGSAWKLCRVPNTSMLAQRLRALAEEIKD